MYNEINGLLAEFEMLLLASTYRLKLKGPRKALRRNGFLNKDMILMAGKLNRSILGRRKEDFLILVILQVYTIMGKVADDGVDPIYE